MTILRAVLVPIIVTTGSIALSACSGGAGDADANGLVAGEAEGLERAVRRLESRATTPGAADSRALEDETRSRVATEVQGNSAN